MSWLSKHLEPTPIHLAYLVLSTFLILHALFSSLIRNRLHLSEPPLATLCGIAFGPHGANVLNPQQWETVDHVTQEATRMIVGLQVFTVGIELPKHYFSRHWKSVAMLLGPVMTFSWLITAAFIYAVLGTEFTIALIISACLAPTDPVLAASVLAESRFSHRIPRRLRHLLSAESGCNDGTSFPFLYLALYLHTKPDAEAAKEWFLSTILWQCVLGLLIGLLTGFVSNKALRFAQKETYIAKPAFLAFYLLLAIFSVGIGSTLGVDDFLVAFGAGYGFARDGWFSNKTRETDLPQVLDLLLNSAMFVYFGAIIPWSQFTPTALVPTVGPLKLVAVLLLILLFRRIPIVLALKPFIPDILTYREALFAGHFGPMGLGALFLVIEARAMLEHDSSRPLPHIPEDSPNKQAIATVWPVVTFVILGSTMVHGLSVAAISVGSHYTRKEGERAPLIGGETEGLGGMLQEVGDGESAPSVSGDEEGRNG